MTHRLPRVGATRVGDSVSIGNTVPVARVGGGEGDEGQNKRCIHGDSLPINESDECSGDSCKGLTVVYVKDSPPLSSSRGLVTTMSKILHINCCVITY